MATTEPVQSPVENEDKAEDKVESEPTPAKVVRENGQEDEQQELAAAETSAEQKEEATDVNAGEEAEEVKGQDESDKPEDKPDGKKQEENEDGDGSEDEEESDDEPQVGSLDGPVKIMTGKRERKKTERLTMQSPKEKEKEKFEIKDGRGIKLGDCPIIEFNIQRTNADVLKPLYRVLFYKAGKTSEIKRNIRKFSGFAFTKEDKVELQRKEKQLERFSTSGLKDLCTYLALEKKGTKEDLINRVIEYCLEPVMVEKKIPAKRKKGSKKSGKKRKSSGKGDTVKRKKKAKSSEAAEEDDDEDDDDEEEEEEEEAAADEDEQEEEESPPEDEDSEYEEPKKKKPRKETPKSAKKTKTPKKSPTKKSTPKTPKSPKSKADVDDDESSDEEAPLVKKSKSPPSESEIRTVITKFLEGANLEQVTMKTVCRMVYDKYPDFDLTSKKDFIKSTVKEIISS